jgi:hypothetical protein
MDRWVAEFTKRRNNFSFILVEQTTNLPRRFCVVTLAHFLLDFVVNQFIDSVESMVHLSVTFPSSESNNTIRSRRCKGISFTSPTRSPMRICGNSANIALVAKSLLLETCGEQTLRYLRLRTTTSGGNQLSLPSGKSILFILFAVLKKSLDGSVFGKMHKLVVAHLFIAFLALVIALLTYDVKDKTISASS